MMRKRMRPSLRGAAKAAAAASVAAGVLAALPAAATSQDGMSSLSGSFLAGHVAQQRHDLPNTIKYLSQALEQDKSNPDILRRTFLSTVMDGQVEEGIELAERFLEFEPRATIATLALAVRDAKNGDWEALEQRMAALDGTGLNSFTAPALRAWAVFAAEGLEKGKEALKPLRDIGGTRALHDLHLGLMHELSGDLAAAETYYLSVTDEENGSSLRASRILGTLYERQGKTEQAKAAFELYLRSQPGSQFVDNDLDRLADEEEREIPTLVRDAKDGVAEALFGIASSLNRQGGAQTALVLGRLALYLRPQFPVMRYMVGGILESLERYEDAIAVYRALPSGTPFTNPAKLRVAHNLDRVDKMDEATALLKQVSADRPNDPRAPIALGDIYRRHERWADAAAAYDQAIARIGTLEPRHWQLLYSRGIVLERAKDWQRAEADFLKALEFEPDQPLVLNYLGYSWIEQGRNLDRALEMIRTAVAKRPHDGYITDSLGWVYYRLGRYEEAVPELERAVELRPEDPVINDHLGDAYWRVGRRLEATFQWSHALNLDPEDELKAVIEKKLEDGLVDEAGAVQKSTTDGG